MILKEWQKFKGWSVLEFFLSRGARVHLKGLARELKISPRTAQHYLNLYAEEGLLVREPIGNMLLYSLADNAVAKELKRAYFLLLSQKYVKEFVNANESVNSVVLYGSYASGEYDKSSDVDLLIISQSKNLDMRPFKKLESAAGAEVKIEVISIGGWREIGRKGNHFYNSVSRNNIVLYGARI